MGRDVAPLREVGLVVFAGPREMFSTDEFEAMKEYLKATSAPPPPRKARGAS